MRELQLNHNKFTIVDNVDYGRFAGLKWRVSSHGYAVRTDRSTGKERTIYLHRLINNTPDGLETDHINGNRLDNRRKNLRACTHPQNSMNVSKCKNTTSQFKGVTYIEKDRKWRSRATVGGKLIHIGCFDAEIKAALAYNEFAIKNHGEFAKINNISMEKADDRQD